MTKRWIQFLTQNFREYFNSPNNKMKHVSRERFFIKTNYYHYHYLFTFILLFIFLAQITCSARYITIVSFEPGGLVTIRVHEKIGNQFIRAIFDFF